MPVFRDIAWSFESTTTDAGVSVPYPSHEQEDLLLAFIQSDTGSPTVTSASWARIFTQTNTTNLTVLRKISSGSIEPNSAFFAATVAETYNGAIVSIRDVDTINPINAFNNAAQASAAKFQFQQITTTKDKCLIIYSFANSAVGVPSIIEGPIVGVLGADGAAESQGIGWGFQYFSGSTSNAVTASTIAAGTGVKAVLAINPPTGTTPIIPTYCSFDKSIYIDPINGITAYNGNAALAATADTLITTSLSGTATNDATVAAATDVGLNSFHSTGQLSTVSNTSLWAGAALDLAAGNLLNASGKNILIHTGPSTSGQIQRFPTVSSARKGICVGMFSTTANWKAWYVHGAGTSYGANRDVPLVFNSLNTSGLLSGSGNLNAEAIDVFGFWVSSKGVSTTIWQFYSLWLLDTVAVVGGCAAEPLDIKGFVNAAANGHERKSVLQQGTNQALIFQPIQFGDGGNNPTYMDFNATAIEFPRIHNLITKEINYCSYDNVAGITYYAGPSDTIKHRNSVISSLSPYHWRFDQACNVSASYDFSGLQVIGAGDVILCSAAPILSASFSSCGQIYHNLTRFEDNSVINSPSTSSILTNNPSLIKRTAFISVGAGHAIEARTTGTYSFEGNTFTNYGADNTIDAAFFNNSSGSITLNISSGGGTPTVRNGTNASTTINNLVSFTITGLKSNSEVRIYKVSDNTELAGTENSSTSFTYNYNYIADTAIYVHVHHLDWQFLKLDGIFLLSTNQSIPVQQITDRVYSNP